jgi:hypothetical protein
MAKLTIWVVWSWGANVRLTSEASHGGEAGGRKKSGRKGCRSVDCS